MAHIIPDPASESSDLSSLQIEDFWDRHGKTVIIVAGIALIVAIVAAIVAVMQHNRHLDAVAAFANAKDEAQLQAIIETYPGSAPAANASLLLAQLQRKAGKTDEATATLEAFLGKSGDSPLAGLASLGIAANDAAAGQTEKSREALQQTAARYSSSFVAPYALLSQAEIFLAQNKKSDALTVLRNLTSQYPDSVSARVGAGFIERLESLYDTDSKN